MMSSKEVLEQCCNALISLKVTERKRGVDLLTELLDSEDALKILNSGNVSTTWDDLVRAVHINLLNDSVKLQENEVKNVRRNHKVCPDLLVQVVEKANQGCIRLSVLPLLQIVLECLYSETLTKYFLNNYIMILKDHILPQRHYVKNIPPESWICLLEPLKKMLLLTKCNNSKVAECIKLIFQQGPLYGFPPMQYRSQFQFVADLCHTLKLTTPTRYKAEVLQIMLEYYKGTACDCRLSCCKLGEETFLTLRELYERRSGKDTVKELLFEIFLLLVKLHHPNGACESRSALSASLSVVWKKQLKAIHEIVEQELQYCRMGETPYFVALEIEEHKHVFVLLAVEVYKQMPLNQLELNLDTAQPAKRQKLEVGFDSMLSNLQESKNCGRIYIVTALLQKYPDVIRFDHSMSLLKILLNLQKETKDGDMQQCIYDCFTVLLNVQSNFSDEFAHSENLWEYVVEGVVRSIDMNVNATAIHSLLQNLIKMGKIKESTIIYQTFASGRLSFTSDTLTTFITSAENFGIPQKINGESFKEKIITWIMDYNRNLPNMKTYEEEIVVKALIYLCSKQLPPKSNEATPKKTGLDFESVYVLNTFDSLILSEKYKCEHFEFSQSVNKKFLLTLLDYLKEFLLHFSNNDSEHKGLDYVEQMASVIICVGNLVTELKRLNITGVVEDYLQHLEVKKLFEKFVKTVIGEARDPSKTSLNPLEVLDKILSRKFDSLVSNEFRVCLAQEELRHLFELMKTQDDETSNQDFVIELKVLCMNILCGFCMYDNKDKLSETQDSTITSLSSFNVTDSIDYKMAFTFLSHIPFCSKDLFNDNTLFKILENFSSQGFFEYETKTNVKFLYDITPHVGQSKDNAVHRNYYNLLMNLFEAKNSYGYDFSLGLLKCFERIYQENFYIKCNEYTGHSITVLLSDFLTSNYQVVRLRVVQCLLMIFDEEIDSLDISKLQKAAFTDINRKCQDIINIGGTMDDGRRIEETVTRTSNVLHMYGALIVCNSTWRKNLLFSLLVFIQEKKLETRMVDKLMQQICKELGYKSNEDLFTEFMEYILKQWHSNQDSFESFPRFVIGCESKVDFYKKYVKIVLPLTLADRNRNQIETAIVEELATSVPELYKMCFDELIAVSFLKMAVRSNDGAFDTGKNLYSTMVETLTEAKIDSLLLEKFDSVLVNTLKVIVNEKSYKEWFGIEHKMDIDDYPALTFYNVVNLIKLKLKIQTDFLEHCSKVYPANIQSILFQLTELIYKRSCRDDKFKSLHQYFEFVDMLVTYITPKNPISNFCIRTILHTLLYFTEQKILRSNKFNIASIRYLKTFLQKITPECHEVLSTYLNLIVNKLLPLTFHGGDLAQESVSVLTILIIENRRLFENIIPDLDPLPQCEQLNTINEVYEDLRNEKWGSALQDEILHFLKAGASNWSNCRLEALKHLRKQLSEKKGDLKELFEKTAQIRDFHEKRKDSLLHQLICMLVRLTLTGDANVSAEAACCLGEIGPSDLSTLILHSEHDEIDNESSPFQLLTSHIIKLLYQYIVDTDIEIVKCSNAILFDVLKTKEGQSYIRTTKNIDVSHLYPFIPKQTLEAMSITSIRDEFLRPMDALWWSNACHNKWITDLVCAILTCFPDEYYLKNLIPLCKIKVTFSEEILPYLTLVIASINETCTTILSQGMVCFFHNVGALYVRDLPKNTDTVLSTQCMLQVVQFCRLHEKKVNGICKFDYLKIAQGAFYCCRYFDALFYVELWCQGVIRSMPSLKKFGRSDLTILDIIIEGIPGEVETHRILQNILRKSYLAIGEIDALKGCGHTFLVEPSTRIDHYKQLGKWDQVVLHYHTELSHGVQINEKYFSDALKKASYYKLAAKCESQEEPDFECLWRLSKWDTDVRRKPENTFEYHKYEAVKSLIERDDDVFVAEISNARKAVVDSFKNIYIETTESVYKILTELRMLQELEDFRAARDDHEVTFETLNKWEMQDLIPNVDFEVIEPIKAQRIAVMVEFYNSGKQIFREPLAKCYLNLAGDARKANQFNIAKRAIVDMHLISEMNTKYSYWRVFEDAQIFWAMNDKQTAKYLMYCCTKNIEDKWLQFKAFKLYGEWLIKSQLVNSYSLVEYYFKKPLENIENSARYPKEFDMINDTYYDIARFLDESYQQIKNYMKSAEFEQKQKIMEKSIEASEKFKAQGDLTRDQSRAANSHQQEGLIDQAEISNKWVERKYYFNMAAEYYMKNLILSDTNNILVFRILSLLLENKTSEGMEVLEDYFLKIPTYKFVSIIPQLVPHLSNEANDTFGNCISTIIERCARYHPHHTIPFLITLSSLLDEGTKSTEINKARIGAAQTLLTELKKDPLLETIIKEMDVLSQAFIELASIDHNTCRLPDGTFCIPVEARINRIDDFSLSHVPTVALDVKPNEKYSDVISIVYFDSHFSLVGGKSKPKLITCRCSDGQNRNILVKSDDDLRQDAVMQQVFAIINDLFRKNKHTSKLLIRTYKVMPLTPRSGVAEWVKNSKEIGKYLTELHSKYNPREWPPSWCHRVLADVKNSTYAIKFTRFKEICMNFSPVMHKFFEETYPFPSIFYEKRRAYIHSVATSSMCGYILGIGDRHGANILLDTTTAEVVHIDFGFAFEQGRVLGHPEVVPFRLTRDIEDGMGVCGIDGVFKRTCEKTMEVLRENWQTIVSIVEVLLYDPLYMWTITPEQVYRQQSNVDGSLASRSLPLASNVTPINANVSAERAIARLRQKLHGTEEGIPWSVEGQVEHLVQVARDPVNLSRMFYGWAPYM